MNKALENALVTLGAVVVLAVIGVLIAVFSGCFKP